MFSFLLSFAALILGYFLYGRFIERIIAPTDAPTPATTKADGLDFVVLPSWKVFMIQFLNIAGTGPIFGAIMGAKFGPAAYLWIVFGYIFAGAVHDYFSGMLSLRHGGAGLPEIVGLYLGRFARIGMLLFTLFLLVMLGAVFVYSPASIMDGMCGHVGLWIGLIFAYYLVATLLPVDKIIARFYPIFAFSLLFMAVALMVVLLLKWPSLPEVWDGVQTRIPSNSNGDLFPFLFITIACGALSGFHGTQSPLMARCMKSERQGRAIFYGAMITEGLVALIWATVASYFFYAEPAPGYTLIEAARTSGLSTAAPSVVNLICSDWLGIFGGILAVLGVVAAPITSGDTALRSARLIIADFIRLPQRPIRNRLVICIPLFAATMGVLFWQISSPDGFNVLWQYFGWANQTLAVFTLWSITLYLVRQRRPYLVTLIPALLMTCVCTSFLFVSSTTLHLPAIYGYVAAAAAFLLTLGAFLRLKPSMIS